MKQFRRIVALVLALVLLTGVLPSAIFAQEPETAPAGEAPDAPARVSVQLGTDGLHDADTLILGSAQSGNIYYPLEWMVADADSDSMGRPGGALLVSKYLLPEAQTYSASGGIDTATSYTGVTMPEDYTVLYTTKNDKDYVANLGENVDGLYNKSEIKNTSYYVVGADTAEKRYSLTAAKFFSLSAQELETYFPNDSSNSFTASTSMLARRPYAAGYAVEKSTERVWALRGSDLNGNRVVVEAAKADNPITQDEYTAQAGGLVGAKGEQEALSRPAFNLRKNAISFLYAADVTETPDDTFGTILTTETPLQIAEEQKLDPTTTVTGSTVWRAALEALPMIHASVTYKQDGTLVIDFPETNANRYKVGVLEAAEDGSILRWGTARLTTYDKITMKPDEGVSKLYFFTYTYDTNTCQMLTSNLVEVSAARPSAMTLGATEVRDGDQVLFPNSTAYVISADTGSTGMQGTGIIKNDGDLNSTMTKGAGDKDQYPVWDDEAMFLATKLSPGFLEYLNEEVGDPYVSAGFNLSAAISFADSWRPHLDVPGAAERLNENYENAKGFVANVQQTNAAAKSRNTDMLGAKQDEYFYEVFSTHRGPTPIIKNALAYTWVSDGEYNVSVIYGAGNTAKAQKAEHAVDGKLVFPLSAGEYVCAPQNVKNEFNHIILRSALREEFDLCVENPLVVDTDPAITNNGVTVSLSNYFNEQTVVPAVGFNMKKENVVFMLQKSAATDAVVDCNALNNMTYDPDCTQWNIALLNNSQLQCTKASRNEFVLKGYDAAVSASWRDYISLVVTDSAGTVKQYGRVHEIGNTDTECHFTLELAKLSYGDRVYAIYEEVVAGGFGSNEVISASEPLLIFENKLSGSLKITPDTCYAGETLAVDTSDLKFSAAEKVDYSWYREGKTFYYETDNDTFTVNENTPDIYARLTLDENHRNNYFSAYAKETAAFPVYPGTKDQDFFKGGRLFFGPKDDSSDYSWAIVGKATGVSSVSDNSGNRIFYTGLTADNALELLSTNAYEGVSGTSLNGYMNRTVVRTSTSDAAFTEGAISGLAGTASAQNVFAPAYSDYRKLIDSKTSLFAAFEGGSDAASYLLRNVSNRKLHASVDGWTDLQQKSNSLPTRDAINVNNKAIAFYSPAACDLTYASLKNCRQSNDGNWKLTVYDPRPFYWTKIEKASISGNTVSVSGTWDAYDDLKNLSVTVWAEKNGEIVWLDSVPLESEGNFSEQLTMPEGTSYDDVFAVLRVNNGKYRTDVCSMPTPATPTEVKVEVYVNGRLTDTGCTYRITRQGTEQTKFNTGDLATVSVYADEGFMIQSMEVFFSDGTTEDNGFAYPSAHAPYKEEVLAFNVKGITPTVRIDLSTKEYTIYTGVTTRDRNNELMSVPGGSINVQSGALKDETVNFTVNCKEGYLLFDLKIDGESVRGDMIEIPTKDDRYIPAYKPGETYSFTMPAHDIRIEAEIWQIPGFMLNLEVDPADAGTLTAALPDGESLDDLLGGSEVKLNPTANDGWKLTGLTYKEGEDGKELPFEADENGYEFIMPYSNVTVTAHYAKAHQITSEFMDISDPANPVKTAGAVKYTVNGEEATEFAAGDVVTATVTCANNMNLVSVQTAPETQVERTGTYTVTFTMPDEDLKAVYNFNKLQIRSAYLHVNQDINLIYSVQVPDGFENPTMEFTYLGETYTVDKYTVDPDNGRYCFEFTHITPQCMGETVDATITATKDGATYTHSIKNYSIRKYAQNMLNKSNDPLLITLLSDIMVYGEKSQLYTNYKTDELVSRDLLLKPRTFPGIEGYRNWFVGTRDAGTYWSSVGLVLSNNMSMEYSFYADSIEGLSVNVTVDGRTQTITEFMPVKDKPHFYSFTYRGIYATEFNATVSASFFRNGAQVGNTLNTSVNTYICGKQNNANEKLSELVQAIYNYGVSAGIYYNERIVKQ